MARFEWDSRLSVGHEQLDEQHRELLRIYNRLHESLMNDTAEDTILTKQDTLGSLQHYVRYHFTSEENFLSAIGYPELAGHRRRHQEFTDKIEVLLKDLEQGKLVLSTSLIKMLRNWIVDHIAHEDQQYAQYYRQMRASQQ